MTREVKCIELWFEPKCKQCGVVDEDFPEEQIKTTIVDIVEVGCPICQHCGSDLPLNEKCDVIQ